MIDGLAFDPAKASAAFPDGIGHVTRPSPTSAAFRASPARQAAPRRAGAPRSRRSNSSTRCSDGRPRIRGSGIPVLLHEESLHGYMATEATMFPQAIALAGTFDTDLMRRVQSVIAREVRARGVPLVLSPVVDIVRDPRWGRIEETWGEDPYLVGEMGVAAVEGLQGPGKFEKLRRRQGLRHAEAHDRSRPARGGQQCLARPNCPSANCGRISSRRSAKSSARTSVGAVMPSYNEIDGMPSHANTWLLGECPARRMGLRRRSSSAITAASTNWRPCTMWPPTLKMPRIRR